MDERDRALILEFKGKLPLDLESHLKRFIVFGSRVKGKATEDSDLDLIVLVDKKSSEIEKQLEDIAYQVMWDHDFKPMISLKVVEESQYHQSLDKGFSFYRHVEKEGIHV